MNLLDDLEFRGLLYQVTDREGLDQRLQEGPITLYNGFDPTADSLTIGNLVPILLLRRFQLAGNKPIALAGGGTGLIGDPGGKTQERQLNTVDTVAAWTEKIKAQLEPYLDFDPGPYAAEMVNNYDWLAQVKAIDFMRDIGKHFSVPYMLAKESVASRLETGISYTEFSYMVLQGFDFLHLYQSHSCQLQTGGSDQWGNITAGSDLIRRALGNKAFGLTCPLVTTADGSKFGKTETGTLWLDPRRTSPYQFYQFWINAEDARVVDYLKIFSFLEAEEIEALGVATRDEPHQRQAQRRLAQEVTKLVHGAGAMRKAEKISRTLFSGDLRDLAEDEVVQGFGDVPSYRLAEGERGLVDLLVDAGVSPSKRQARQDIQSGAIYLNGERCQDMQHRVRKAEGLHGKYVVVRRGKNKYFLVD